MEGKMLMVPKLRLVEPNNIYRKVPTRKPNAEMRTREYLTPDEVEKLIAAAKPGRHADPGCLPARLAGRRDHRSGVVAGRVGPQSGTARPQGEERQARRPPYPRRRIAHAARAAAEHDGRLCLRDRARRPVYR